MSIAKRTWTKAEIIEKVRVDLDIQEDEIITESEMDEYLEEAIDAAEEIVNDLDEDYFLTSESLALTAGTARYDLPEKIWASKIRSIVYDNGTRRYLIRRIRTMEKFEKIAEIRAESAGTEPYRYILVNDDENGMQIELLPTPNETSGSNVTIWFLRQANRLENDSDKCDIPESISFIFAHLKKSCLTKMNNGETPPAADKAVDVAKDRVVNMLTRMTPDNDDVLEFDLSHYCDHN